MRIRLEETKPGEFDQSPEELELNAVRAARMAVMQLLGESLKKGTFQSHTKMPKVGDRVRNTNTKCVHFQSEGVVTAVNDLPGGAGKTISYKTTNGGGKWEKGQVLKKTPDQLSPMTESISKALARGGEMDVLDDLATLMAAQYAERIKRIKVDLAIAIRDRNEK